LPPYDMFNFVIVSDKV